MEKDRFDNFNIQEILLDIANWTSREPYGIRADIERKIASCLQRKYKSKFDSKKIKERIRNYKEIYSITKENLSRYTLPSKSGYAEPQYVKNAEIKKFLAKRFPAENKKILDTIINWVVYYEYLR